MVTKRLFAPTHSKRFLFFFLFDFGIIVFSLYFSFFIRFEFDIPIEYKLIFLKSVGAFVVVKLMVFAYFRIYKVTWRYVGLHDMLNIIRALIVSELILMVLILVSLPFLHASYILTFLPFDFYVSGFPRSIFLLDGLISFFLFCGLRISKRIFFEIVQRKNTTTRGKRTIIIGAGNTGEMIVRDMSRHPSCDYYPVGFLDDDRTKIGMYMRGLKVYGTVGELCAVIIKYKIEAVIIAIPSLNHRILREIYSLVKELKVGTIKIVPRIYDFHKPDINIKCLEDISIEDLLGRQAISVDYKALEIFLKNKVVLVTGAGGSIGSEIVSQVCSFQPEKVILFDIDETELHSMKLRLEKMFPDLFYSQWAGSGKQESGNEKQVEGRWVRWRDSLTQDKAIFITGDIRDEDAVYEVFRKFNPHIVFHAAAYKHVPMMENNPKEAVKVNMFGTYNVAKASVQYNADKFILISSDKAVKPTSIMGATKRMAEYIGMAFDNGITSFMSVRFGNVLGSRGSVLPTFLDQLKHGGPLTVTHKDMKRYFMTIPEAVSLVLQASVIGNRNEVLVLDMGEPLKIVNLAEELIRIHGMQPYQDVDIEFVGLRPGEKLFEELLTAEEGTNASKHEKIFIAKNGEGYSRYEVEQILSEFRRLLKGMQMEDYGKIRELLKKYVKHYAGYNREEKVSMVVSGNLL